MILIRTNQHLGAGVLLEHFTLVKIVIGYLLPPIGPILKFQNTGKILENFENRRKVK